MKSLRVKLIVTLVSISVLPVFPVYYVVKGLLQQSMNVGYNENVQTALDHAAGFSKQLFNEFQRNTVDRVKILAARDCITELLVRKRTQLPDTVLNNGERIDLYDIGGRHMFSFQKNLKPTVFPEVARDQIVHFNTMEAPGIASSNGSAGFISAFSPVKTSGRQLGTLLLSWQVDSTFIDKSGAIIEVNQIFKTLDIFRGSLTEGFLLSFVVVYLPIAALAVFVGIYFSRRFTSPLEELVRGTQRIAAGDWQHRVRVRSNDEVGLLVEAFNVMVAAIKEKQDQVIALERMAAWQEMARVLAHEIKNPLTPIQLMVQQLSDKYGMADEDYGRLLTECTEIINDEIENLRKLAMEFSEFARMPELNRGQGSLNELILEVTRLYPDDDISLKLDEHLSESLMDWPKIRRLLINLIENSLDSIAEKGSGSIEIITAAADNSVVLQCSDTGTGIPADLQAKIFEPYFSTKRSGMGLGMAIVKRIVTEHGGTVSVSSTEGEGTTFRIVLPVKPVISD